MLRSSLVVTGAALLCSVASAQNLTKMYPVTAPIKDAGVYNMATGKFQTRSHAASLGAAQQKVYTNTCNNTSGAWYSYGDYCEDWFDEGRIPASGPTGAGPDNNTNTWQIAYCTGVLPGSVDLDWEVFDTTVGGTDSCTLYSTNPPAPDFTAGLVGFDSSAAGNPLPGATNGFACWLVTFTTTTPVCMKSGATSADLFNWRFRNNNTSAQYGGAGQGPILAGGYGATGADTYNIPPAIDPIGGNTCGSGLDTQDLFWVNTDNCAIGGTPTCPQGIGTNCYWFGGSPTAPFASFYFRIEADGGCTGCANNPSTYCTSKTASNGCVPTIGTPSSCVGVAAANANTVSNITVSNISEKPSSAAAHLGQLFYSKTGPNGAAFNGGFLCVKGPIIRVQPAVSTGGTPGASTCLSAVTQDFNHEVKIKAIPAGTPVWIQGWARDTAAFAGIQLSNGLSITVGP